MASFNYCIIKSTPSKSILLAVAAFTIQTASADITSVEGSVVLREPPPSILLNEWESDSEIRAWYENQVTLSSDVSIPVGSGFVNDFSHLVFGTLSSGTSVRTYMVRFDPIAVNGSIRLDGAISFDTPILGVIIGNQLVATDDELGSPGVNYNENLFRGMELDSTDPEADSFEISPDRLRIELTMEVDPFTDDIRIVTESSCLADLTGDGVLNFFDVSAFLAAFAASDQVADFTGDGAFNFFDVSAFLSAFTSGCP